MMPFRGGADFSCGDLLLHSWRLLDAETHLELYVLYAPRQSQRGLGEPPLSPGSCWRPHSLAGYIVLGPRYYSGFVSPYMTLNATYKMETQKFYLN